MFGLNLDQMALFEKIGRSILGQVGIALGRLGGKRCRSGV
jgi:hypothetical protein